MDADAFVALARAGDVGGMERARGEAGTHFDADEKNAKGFTALQMAAWEGHAAAVAWLCAEGKADAEGKRERLARNRAVELVGERGRCWRLSSAPQTLAAVRGHRAVVEALRAAGCEPSEQTRNEGGTAAHGAAFGGHRELLEWLAEECGCAYDQRDSDGQTPLHCAATAGHAELARYLLEERGCAVNATRDDGHTMVHATAAGGLLGLVRRLVEEHGCAADAKRKDGSTPVHSATLGGHLNVVRYLVEECGCAAGSKSSDGFFPLQSAAQNGHLAVVRYLAEECGCAADAEDEDGWMPLHSAAQEGHLAVVRYLVEERGCAADSALALNGWTAVHAAALNGHLDVARYLVEERGCAADAKMNNGATPLHSAASNGQLHLVQYLVLGCGAPTVPRKKLTLLRMTPASVARDMGHQAVARWLSNAGPSLHRGVNTLHFACTGRLPGGSTPPAAASVSWRPPAEELSTAFARGVELAWAGDTVAVLAAALREHCPTLSPFEWPLGILSFAGCGQTVPDSLVSAIAALVPAIRRLDLSGTAWPGQLPAALAELPSLDELTLTGCGLRATPWVLASLPSLRRVHGLGDGNPDLPAEFRAQLGQRGEWTGRARAYLRDGLDAANCARSRRALLLLYGSDNVGKTCFKEAMVRGPLGRADALKYWLSPSSFETRIDARGRSLAATLVEFERGGVEWMAVDRPGLPQFHAASGMLSETRHAVAVVLVRLLPPPPLPGQDPASLPVPVSPEYARAFSQEGVEAARKHCKAMPRAELERLVELQQRQNEDQLALWLDALRDQQIEAGGGGARVPVVVCASFKEESAGLCDEWWRALSERLTAQYAEHLDFGEGGWHQITAPRCGSRGLTAAIEQVQARGLALVKARDAVPASHEAAEGRLITLARDPSVPRALPLATLRAEYHFMAADAADDSVAAAVQFAASNGRCLYFPGRQLVLIDVPWMGRALSFLSTPPGLYDEAEALYKARPPVFGERTGTTPRGDLLRSLRSFGGAVMDEESLAALLEELGVVVPLSDASGAPVYFAPSQLFSSFLLHSLEPAGLQLTVQALHEQSQHAARLTLRLPGRRVWPAASPNRAAAALIRTLLAGSPPLVQLSRRQVLAVWRGGDGAWEARARLTFSASCVSRAVTVELRGWNLCDAGDRAGVAEWASSTVESCAPEGALLQSACAACIASGVAAEAACGDSPPEPAERWCRSVRAVGFWLSRVPAGCPRAPPAPAPAGPGDDFEWL